MKYLINISYDGSQFYGSQRQKNKRTVLGEIDLVLSKIFNEEIKSIASSRTDTHVHANDQYLTFISSHELSDLKYRLNKLLPKDIHVKNIRQVSDEFNVRYNVKNKEYVYKINMGEYNPFERNYVLQYNKKINISLLNKAKKYLIGEHNFKSFTSDNEKENYVRTINYIRIKKINNYVFIYINGNGFLKYMVRNIVGLFLEINEGRISLNDINDILKSEDRTKNGICVEGNGLYLNKIVFFN